MVEEALDNGSEACVKGMLLGLLVVPPDIFALTRQFADMSIGKRPAHSSKRPLRQLDFNGQFMVELTVFQFQPGVGFPKLAHLVVQFRKLELALDTPTPCIEAVRVFTLFPS
jgi:hypothetical protein